MLTTMRSAEPAGLPPDSRRIRGRLALVCLSLAVSAGLVSCSSVPDRDRGSLSDAMDKARDDNEGSRSVPDAPAGGGDLPDGAWIVDPPSRSPRRGSVDADDETPSDPLVTGYQSDRLSFGFRGSYDLASSEPWSSPVDFDLIAGVSGENAAMLGYLGLRTVDPGEGSAFEASIEDSAGILRVGLQFRWFPFPGRQYLAPQLDVALGGFVMGWTYRNALTAGNDTILGDSLGGAHLALGAGVSLARWERAEFGLRVVSEAYLFGDKTDEGFDNDFFAPLGVVKLVGEVMFR